MVGTLYVMAPVDACFDWRIADKKAGALLATPALSLLSSYRLFNDSGNALHS